MHRFFTSLSVLLITCATSLAEMQTVTPKEDLEVVLSNPDMGWILYENYPLDPRSDGSSTMLNLPETSFDGCDHVAVMFAWSDVEKLEGRYDWSKVDKAWDHWTARGKSIQLRMSTEPLFGWSRLRPAGGLGIPEWLLAGIPGEQKQLRKDEQGNFGWHVDARNALYRERLKVFLTETRAHLSGPRRPTLVDLRGFGRWGEWHTGFRYPTVEERREALAILLDLWTEVFDDQMLALSYSYDPDGPAALNSGPKNRYDPAFTANYQEFLHYSAFDLALLKPNITLRRDGVGGAVSSNERKLSSQVYRDLRRAPQVSEFVGSYAKTRQGGPDHLSWAVDDALSLHPNYINLLGYGSKDAFSFMRDRPDLVARGMRGMGYRIVPLKINLPKVIRAGEKFAMDIQWTNRAAGRALRDFRMKVRIVDNNSTVLAETDAGSVPTSQWLQNEKHITRGQIIFPALKGSGPAALQISLVDAATGKAINLPLVPTAGKGFHVIANVEVEP